MISIDEQQALNSLADNAQNIKALVAPMKEWVREQGEADKKTHGQIVNIAYGR